MASESSCELKINSLVIYKSNPARVTGVGSKIEIELKSKEKVSVRDKDIIFLHGGPVNSLSDLDESITGEIADACEMLGEEKTTLELFAELAFGTYSPSSALAAYRLLQDGLYITGTPQEISVRSKDEIDKTLHDRNQKAAEKEEWQRFITQLRNGKFDKNDSARLVPLQDIAFGKVSACRILRELDLPETPLAAHMLLLRLGAWDYTVNPYIQRLGFNLDISYPEAGETEDEARLDLTHLESFAIDDEGNKDPDDAISIDGNRIWIHVADVAAAVKPSGDLDNHARNHATTLYLPEKTVTMLPQKITDTFGLGLQEISPALSFGITLNDDGSIDKYEIAISKVKVTRTTYAQVRDAIETEPFCKMYEMTSRYRENRKAANAVFLSFPEARIRVENGTVSIKPLPDMCSKDMVTDAMLMAGEAAARFAIDNKIPFPYTTQQSPETIENPSDCAGMFAYRKKLKPSEVKSTPDIHAGLGLKAYSRVTSPLRRYIDLLAHQQLRAFLGNRPVLDDQEITNRIGFSAAVTGSAQNLERQSNLHWTMVYLQQNPSWHGKGIVAEVRDRYSIVLIPDLALETRVSASKPLEPNQEIILGVKSVDLPGQSAHFSIV